jgi:hypothetical protein
LINVTVPGQKAAEARGFHSVAAQNRRRRNNCQSGATNACYTFSIGCQD